MNHQKSHLYSYLATWCILGAAPTSNRLVDEPFHLTPKKIITTRFMQLENKSPSIEELDGVRIDELKFCTIAYDIFDSIRAKNDGINWLRQQSSRIEKKLLEELIPISRYIQKYYRHGRGISVIWKNRNQMVDAEIHQQAG